MIPPLTGWRPKAELAAIAGKVPIRSGGDLLQHRPLGRDRLVRAVGRFSAGRMCGSMPDRWSNGAPIRSARSDVVAAPGDEEGDREEGCSGMGL